MSEDPEKVFDEVMREYIDFVNEQLRPSEVTSNWRPIGKAVETSNSTPAPF